MLEIILTEKVLSQLEGADSSQNGKDISEQLGQLSTGGQSSQDGAFDLFNMDLGKI